MSKGEISESIKVFVRERPTCVGPLQEGSVVSQSDTISGVRSVTADRKSCVYYSASNKMQQTFAMDQFFGPDTIQSDVYTIVAEPIVESALEGYSGTILAYGPTSSGKTYTMRGGDEESRGIMPRCIERILQYKETSQCEIWASYLQIYCETITDLLWQPSNNADTADGIGFGFNQPLQLRERSGPAGASSTAVYVEGLSRYAIQTANDLTELLRRGDLNRSTAATNMNETSSRSHAVLIVKVVTPDTADPAGIAREAVAGTGTGPTAVPQSYRESTLMLVDLAGSERASASEGRSHLRSEEARAINLSLSALGNCMSALAAPDTKSHVPYRDSKLTRLLQGCLGGRARTAVVVTLAPGSDTAGESLSALRFASRASKVKVAATVTRVRDFEALYREAKQRIKEFQSSGTDTRVQEEAAQRQIAEKDQILKQRDSTIEQQAVEIAMLRQQLEALRGSSSGGGATTGGNSSGTAVIQGGPADSNNNNNNTSASAAAEEEAVAAANRQHAVALEAAHRTFKAKLLIAQQAEQAALRELSARQEDLKQERERSLQTLRQLREAQERRNEEELAHKARTAEFLDEIAALRDTIDDMTAKNEALTQRARELAVAAAESISKAQVQEMERLFVETVTKLSDRVNLLEGKRGSSAPATGAGSAAHSGPAAGAREVRIEPGGRIRAGGAHTGSGRLPADSGSSRTASSAAAPTMQHSQSTGAAVTGGRGLGPIAGDGSGGGGSEKERRNPSGKLW